MKNDIFNKHVEDQIQRCEDMLFRKEDEYAGKNPDRLHNFQAFADLAGVSLEQVCGGYLGKHLVSIYDMIGETSKGVQYDLSKWDEKIGDAINYLLILAAIVRNENVECVNEDPRSKVVDRMNQTYGVHSAPMMDVLRRGNFCTSYDLDAPKEERRD